MNVSYPTLKQVPSCEFFPIQAVEINADNARVTVKRWGTGTDIIGSRREENLFVSLMTREERLLCENMESYFRLSPDNRDPSYDKFLMKGEVHIMTDESYTSHNLHRLDMQGTVKKILATACMRNKLEFSI